MIFFWVKEPIFLLWLKKPNQQDSKALDSKPQVDYWYWLINMMAANRSKKMFRCVKQSIEMG